MHLTMPTLIHDCRLFDMTDGRAVTVQRLAKLTREPHIEVDNLPFPVLGIRHNRTPDGSPAFLIIRPMSEGKVLQIARFYNSKRALMAAVDRGAAGALTLPNIVAEAQVSGEELVYRSVTREQAEHDAHAAVPYIDFYDSLGGVAAVLERMSDPRLFVVENRPERHMISVRLRGETLQRSKLRLSADRPIHALMEAGHIRDLLRLPRKLAEVYEMRSHYCGNERTWRRHNWNGPSEAVIGGRHYRVLLEDQCSGKTQTSQRGVTGGLVREAPGAGLPGGVEGSRQPPVQR